LPCPSRSTPKFCLPQNLGQLLSLLVGLSGGEVQASLPLFRPPLFNKLRHLGLTPWLYYQVKLWGLEGLLPPEAGRLLRQDYLSSLLISGAQQEEISKLIELLNQAKIKPILLKGADLRKRLYLDAAVRLITDLDLLIGLDSLGDAKAVLEEAGYALTPYYHDLRPGHFLLIWNELHFSPPAGKSLEIDLHWELMAAVFFYRLPYPELQKEAVPLNYHGLAAYALSLEHTVIHLCLRAFQIFPDIRIMFDLALFLSSFPVHWEKLRQDTSFFQCQYPVYLILRETARLLPDLIPPAVLERLANYRPSLLDLLMSRPRLSQASFAFPAFYRHRNISQWLIYVRNNLFPHPDYLTAVYGKSGRAAHLRRLLQIFFPGLPKGTR